MNAFELQPQAIRFWISSLALWERRRGESGRGGRVRTTTSESFLEISKPCAARRAARTSILRSKPASKPQSPNVNSRTLLRVIDCPTQYFSRHRSSVPFAKHEIFQQVGDGVPFRPAEIGMRNFAGQILDMNE